MAKWAMGLFIFLVKKEMQAAMEEKSVRIRSNSNFLHKTDKVQPPFGDCTLLYPENHSLGEWFKRGCCR